MRLIDADALIEGLLVNPEECPGCPEPEWIEDFINTVDAAPTIEITTHNEGSQCTQNVEDEREAMTREEAVNVLRNTWLNAGRVNGKTVFAEALNMAIRALETQPNGDTIGRQAAVDAAISADMENHSGILSEKRARVIDRHISAVPSAQPEITPDGTLNVSIDADIANVGRILLSQAGTQRGGLYYKDEQPEPTLEQIQEYCHKRCLSIVDNALLYKYTQSEIQPEIIRCRDCKHYKLEIGDESYALGWCPFIKSHLVMINGFCAWAERRTDGTEQP